MRQELQQKLFADFPGLFKQKTLPMSQTCMCWGIDTGDGWYDIIHNLCEQIVELDPTVEAVQVKEKFGTLRFYVSHGNEAVDLVIREATHLSYRTCERCGSTEDVSQTSGWIHTLCKKCLEAK